MRLALRFFLPMLAFALFCGAAKAPEIVVRFFGEAKAQDTERFASPVVLQYPQRPTYIERVPIISERNIKSIYPYPAGDGTWGCLLKLDESGRLNLEVASTERRGSSIVVFVGGKKNPRQVVDMMVDKPIRDGIASIPRGLTEADVALLKKTFKKTMSPKKTEPAATPASTMPRDN